MPLGAMMKSTMLIGVKTSTQQPTGEWAPSYSYAKSLPISCRIYDRSADSRQGRFGDTMEVEAIVLVPASVSIKPLVFSSGSGERQQIKVDGTVYEVVKVRNQGNVARIREIWVKRWK